MDKIYLIFNNVLGFVLHYKAMQIIEAKISALLDFTVN